MFCDGQASTKEDVWPSWLMKSIPDIKAGTMEASRGGKTLESWKNLKPEQKVKYVCGCCNNGWMSQLENRVKPIIEALFSQEPVRLDNINQITLAQWSVMDFTPKDGQ